MAQQLALGRCSPCPQKLFGIPKKFQCVDWEFPKPPESSLLANPLSERGQSVGGHEFHCFIVIDTHTFLGPMLTHDFIGAGHNGLNQGLLRNPDNPDKILDSAAAEKIRHYRASYRQNRHVAFLPACMTTSGRIHGEFLRLLYFISNKQAVAYFEALGYEAH